MKSLLLSLFLSVNAFASFDHSHKNWDQILKQYTLKKGNQVYFQYKNLKQNQASLNTYLSNLESVTKDDFKGFSDDQQLAFWINAYNAYTIKIILMNYPVESIKDIGSGLFSSGPWKKKFINLLGKKLSLDNIEHDIIRKKFKEPRIHFAVNCASVGCPSLLQESFVGANLETQLDQTAQNFLQNNSKNFLEGETLYLSRIFKWYGEDFDQKYGGFENYVISILKLPNKKYRIEFGKYDWSLNELKKAL